MQRLWRLASRRPPFGARVVARPQSSSAAGGGSAAGAGGGDKGHHYPNVPLSEPFPLTRKSASTAAALRPQDKVTSTSAGASKTTVTRLANGLRVASEPSFGQYCTVGVIVDSGSRYEVAHPSGVCHFLEKLAFSSTEKFSHAEEIATRSADRPLIKFS